MTVQQKPSKCGITSENSGAATSGSMRRKEFMTLKPRTVRGTLESRHRTASVTESSETTSGLSMSRLRTSKNHTDASTQRKIAGKDIRFSIRTAEDVDNDTKQDGP